MTDQGQHSNPHQQASITPPPTSMLIPANRRSTRASTRSQVPMGQLSSLSMETSTSSSQAISEDEYSLPSTQPSSLGGWQSLSTLTGTAARGVLDGSWSPLSSPPPSSPESSTNAAPSLIVRFRYSPTLSSGSTMAGGSEQHPSQSVISPNLDAFDTQTTNAARKKAVYGITNISILGADQISQPLPGEELLRMVEDAKNRGEIPKNCNSGVVRRVDGKWMAPQMCKSCQQGHKGGCDRQSPCSSCVNTKTTCQTDGYMTTLKATRNAANFKVGVTTNSNHAEGPLAHSPVGQNQDGSWFSQIPTESEDPTSLVGGRKRRAVPAKSSQKSIVEVASDADVDSMEITEPEIEMPFQGLHGKKRKSVDDDFASSSNPSFADIQEGIEMKPARKRKAPRSSKAPNRSVQKSAYHVNVQHDKPEPFGEPPVWADKRQQLCETLPYYRAYQSGAHTSDGVVYGFLCDKEVGVRDKFDDQIMIARVGGGREEGENGKRVQTRDQDKSAYALAFRRSMDLKIPVCIIAGQGNSISPSKLPHYYNILDWFHVTDVWCEKNDGFKCWMVRLEKINLAERSWWSPKDSESYPPTFDHKTESLKCMACQHSSKHIYNQGWTCLNPQCSNFFEFNACDDATLDFNLPFLAERTPYTGATPGPLAPPLLTDEDLDGMDAFGIEKECKQGIVCPKCLCCSRRLEWTQWSCENPSCDFQYRLRQKPVPISHVISQNAGEERKSNNRDHVSGGIRVGQMILGRYDVYEYIIPGENGEDIGFVRHFKANNIINQQPDGPNDLFRMMQESDFGLLRNAARQKGSAGEILTRHWAANWGAPYKYGVAQISKGFDEAPKVIIKAVKRLTWCGKQAVTSNFEPFHDFNELLSIGYFEDCDIGYHDDGEKELGPTVASLSLGASATMKWRPKAKSKLGVVKGKGNAKGTKPDALRITLDHGDIMVMHGPNIQQLYEHAVDPHGKLRFALTCRYIRPEMMTSEAERQHTMVKGSLPPGSEQYDYHGDIHATAVQLAAQNPLSEITKLQNLVKAQILTGEIDEHQARESFERFLASLAHNKTTVEKPDEEMKDVA